MGSSLVEIFGYIGSVLVVISMLMSSVIKLRIINSIGSIISCIYALIIGSFPLALMNFCLIIINIYNLFKLRKNETNYDIIQSSTNDSLTAYLLTKHSKDIKRYFPNIYSGNETEYSAYITFCGGKFAGILVADKADEDTMNIVLDYSSPEFRDCSVAKYLYSKLPSFGIRKLCFDQETSKEHVSYLNKMGFTNNNGKFIKEL